MNNRPTVVLPLLYDVDLIASARRIAARWSMLCLEHRVRARLPVNPLRVAIAIDPNLRPRVFASDEGIVLWNCAVIIQPQYFPAERIQSLRNLFLRRLARCDVELRVRSKAQTASGMKLRRRDVLDNNFAVGQTVSCLAVAHDAVALAVAAIISVAEVELMILRKLRMKSQ